MKDARTTFTILATATAVTLGPAGALAQEPMSTSERARADSLFDAQAWSAATEAYDRLVRRAPDDGVAWFRLGVSLAESDRPREAIEAFERTMELDFFPPIARYRLALAHAGLDDLTTATDWLERAVEAGFSAPQPLREDDRWSEIRDRARFREIVASAERNASPCLNDPVYEQFDFWVGDWDVYDPSGEQVGVNTIEKTLDGCMLLENWTGSSGSEGKSINYYDPEQDRWIQVWVDGSGGTIRVQGEFRDGAMRFRGRHIYRTGRIEDFRMTFTPQPDGSVRQYIEQSPEGSDVWYMWFDGRYVRHEE